MVIWIPFIPLRDQYGADLVALLTTTSDNGGLASTMSHPSLGFESSGFSVNDWDQIGAPSSTPWLMKLGIIWDACITGRIQAIITSQYDFGAFCYGKALAGWWSGI